MKKKLTASDFEPLTPPEGGETAFVGDCEYRNVGGKIYTYSKRGKSWGVYAAYNIERHWDTITQWNGNKKD